MTFWSIDFQAVNFKPNLTVVRATQGIENVRRAPRNKREVEIVHDRIRDFNNYETKSAMQRTRRIYRGEYEKFSRGKTYFSTFPVEIRASISIRMNINLGQVTTRILISDK